MELHGVYAIHRDPETALVRAFRVGRAISWGAAQRRWARLVANLGDGRKVEVAHLTEGALCADLYPIFCFEVRSVDENGRGLGSERHEEALTIHCDDLMID